MKNALATQYIQTGKLALFSKLNGPNNNDLSLSFEKNRSIEVTQTTIEATRNHDYKQTEHEKSKEDLVKTGGNESHFIRAVDSNH